MVTGPPYSRRSMITVARMRHYINTPAAARGLSQYAANKCATQEEHYQMTKSNSQCLILGPDKATLLFSTSGDSKRWSFQDMTSLVCSPVLGASSSKIDRSMKR